MTMRHLTRDLGKAHKFKYITKKKKKLNYFFFKRVIY